MPRCKGLTSQNARRRRRLDRAKQAIDNSNQPSPAPAPNCEREKEIEYQQGNMDDDIKKLRSELTDTQNELRKQMNIHHMLTYKHKSFGTIVYRAPSEEENYRINLKATTEAIEQLKRKQEELVDSIRLAATKMLGKPKKSGRPSELHTPFLDKENPNSESHTPKPPQIFTVQPPHSREDNPKLTTIIVPIASASEAAKAGTSRNVSATISGKPVQLKLISTNVAGVKRAMVVGPGGKAQPIISARFVPVRPGRTPNEIHSQSTMVTSTSDQSQCQTKTVDSLTNPIPALLKPQQEDHKTPNNEPLPDIYKSISAAFTQERATASTSEENITGSQSETVIIKSPPVSTRPNITTSPATNTSPTNSVFHSDTLNTALSETTTTQPSMFPEEHANDCEELTSPDSPTHSESGSKVEMCLKVPKTEPRAPIERTHEEFNLEITPDEVKQEEDIDVMSSLPEPPIDDELIIEDECSDAETPPSKKRPHLLTSPLRHSPVPQKNKDNFDYTSVTEAHMNKATCDMPDSPETQRSLSFMAALDLITPAKLSMLEKEKLERKRRKRTVKPPPTFTIDQPFTVTGKRTRRPPKRLVNCSGDDQPSTSKATGKRKEKRQKHEDFCTVCETGGQLLLCDTCNLVYHLHCVNLKTIPKGQWCCPKCVCQKEYNEPPTRREEMPAKRVRNTAQHLEKIAFTKEKIQLVKKNEQLMKHTMTLKQQLSELNEALHKCSTDKDEIKSSYEKAKTMFEKLTSIVRDLKR